MGAPISAGLRQFLRNTPPTDEEVVVLVESQAKIAKGVFQSAGLSTLGNQVYVKTPEKSGLTMLEQISGLVEVEGVCTMKTQGIFFAAPESESFWGYTRDGLWVICIIAHQALGRPYSVVTISSSVSEIITKLRVRPMDIAGRLQAQMQEIVDYRKDSLKDAEMALRDMKTETRFYYILKESEQP